MTGTNLGKHRLRVESDLFGQDLTPAEKRALTRRPALQPAKTSVPRYYVLTVSIAVVSNFVSHVRNHRSDPGAPAPP